MLTLGSGIPSLNPQLPAQMFTTAAQLLDLTDKKLMISLRDGRKLIGILRSWDQFGMLAAPHFSPRIPYSIFHITCHGTKTHLGPCTANIVLQSTIERIFVAPTPAPSSSLASAPAPAPAQPGLYADIPRGLFLVRGENVLLLGEIDLDKDDDAPPGYERADAELVQRLVRERSAGEAKRDKNRLKKLAELGFEGENSGEAIFG
ncbi:hypothetical protein DSL72_002911 [Monilinia vaccinii-corymbosi]|uniref:U6 snRNA-associated Sm-like protein LSm1 n=1 Tax=Monilinia vaccinii-corymbosi TaxID=61207 RepID=A0A8A3PE38_9HELO|nr:hypothetical protein DSL72_002911 [Monilinia vaccinii-corymbosi]